MAYTALFHSYDSVVLYDDENPWTPRLTCYLIDGRWVPMWYGDKRIDDEGWILTAEHHAAIIDAEARLRV